MKPSNSHYYVGCARCAVVPVALLTQQLQGIDGSRQNQHYDYKALRLLVLHGKKRLHTYKHIECLDVLAYTSS